MSGAYLLYTPPAVATTDTFTYTWFSQYLGTPVTGTVSIIPESPDLTAPQTITGLATNNDGSVTISFAGIPNRTYLIQAATNIVSPTWVTIGTNTAASNGLFQFIDSGAIANPTRFYRTATP